MPEATKAPVTPTPAPAPAPEAPAWAQALLDRIDRLEGDLRETRAQQPTFQPMAPAASARARGGIFAEQGKRFGGTGTDADGLREGVSKQIFCDERGDKLPAMILTQHPPPFLPGDRVRINPEAVRDGWPEGRTWGTVLREQRTDGVGIVRKVFWLKDDGRWKVSATIRGITNQRPDGFLDSELLPL